MKISPCENDPFKPVPTVDSEMFARTYSNSLPREFKVLTNIENT